MKSTSPLKIVFMGTPDFAVPALEALEKSQHQVQAVVTVPDKQQGRGRKKRPSAVKATALKLDLRILQPEKLKDPDFVDTLSELAPDLIVVVAFRILPEEIFSIPALGSFNLHASLLPRYRGAAPIHWALLNGDKETGVTTFFLKRRVDTGNVILQSKVRIHDDDNLHTLYEKLCNLGAELVLETVDRISAGDLSSGEQDNALATPAPKVTSETRRLDFNEGAEACHNRTRAFSPSPGAFTYRSGTLLKILSTQVVSLEGSPGSIVEVSDNTFTIACAQNALEVHIVQPESKKKMDVSAYLRGNPLKPGDTLG